MAFLLNPVTLAPITPANLPELSAKEDVVIKQIDAAEVKNMSEEATLEDIIVDLGHFKTCMDFFFVLVMGAIILFMQSGFAFLEAGSVRSKNVTNILIKNFADLCFGGTAFLGCGYALAFGPGNPYIGYTYFATVGLPPSLYAHIFMQCTFAATTATIVSGAIAERCNFNGYIIFSLIITGIIYPISTHWCWTSEGFLAQRGFTDFAGSAVVHMAGATNALVGAVILGPRIGRWKKDGISGHSVPLICLGAFILIFCFMAFNGGSQGSISNPGDGEAVAVAIVNTLVGCACSGTATLFAWKLISGNWSLLRIINGSLAGMVSICAGCNQYYPWDTAIISITAAGVYLIVSSLMVGLKIDDPLDAVAVHGGGGIIGIMAVPVFMKNGLIYGYSEEAMNVLTWNAAGAGVITAYHFVCAIAMFGALHLAGIFRLDEATEMKGADIVKHGEAAYPRERSRAGSLSLISQMFTPKPAPVLHGNGVQNLQGIQSLQSVQSLQGVHGLQDRLATLTPNPHINVTGSIPVL